MRGIDAQIMVTKSAELTGERARLLRQNDLQAGQAALQVRRQAGQDLKRTPAAGQVKGGRVSPDGQGYGGAQYDAEGGGRKQENAANDDLLLPAEEEKRTIDIVI